MKDLISVFSPCGEEENIRHILKQKFKDKFKRIETDNMGNLAGVSGNGGICIECGMDSVGVMVVSVEDNRARFAPVGKVKVCDVLDRTIEFDSGTKGRVRCDEEIDQETAKLTDLYIEFDGSVPHLCDFGGVMMEFEEDESSYSGYGLGNRIALAAVCKAIENGTSLEDITVLFSAQKRLGGRGLAAFFRANRFEKIITVDKSSDDGFTVVAKDARAVSSVDLRRSIEKIAEQENVFAQTVVSECNFCLEQISVSAQDPCVALGISVLSKDGEPDRVSKTDFDEAVKLLGEIMEKGV